MEKLNKVKGTQDILNTNLYDYIIETSCKFLLLNNFKKIVTPILEHTSLFKRSLGIDTDVVTKQIYLIAQQSSSEESVCLRPEITASIMRAYLNENIENVPYKVFSWGPIFRYERPQKGRLRQFNQISIEILATESVEQDIQFIYLLNTLFESYFNFFDYTLHLNYLGCPQDRADLKENLYKYIGQHTLCETCNIRKESNILRIFDCKNEECQLIYKDAPKIHEYLCEQCSNEWVAIQTNLKALSVSFIHQENLVRGLDYYDKIVFEFTSSLLGAQSTFAGGGRYNGLAEQLGFNKHVPSIGVGIGLERLMIILEQQMNLESLEILPEYCIVPMESEQKLLAIMIANKLTLSDIKSDIILEDIAFKSKMKKADKTKAKKLIIIGPDEQKSNQLTIKDMTTSEQITINSQMFFDTLD